MRSDFSLDNSWETKHFFFLFPFSFNLTYSRWTSSLPSYLWSQKDLPISPRFTPYNFLSRCKFSTLTTRQPIMVEFYLLTSPRFPLRKKEHKSYFGKNRTHDFRTSRCAGYLLTRTKDTMSLDYNEICNIGSRIGWVLKEIYKFMGVEWYLQV